MASDLASDLELEIRLWDGPTVVTADVQPLRPLEMVSMTVFNRRISVQEEAAMLKTFGPKLIGGRSLL